MLTVCKRLWHALQYVVETRFTGQEHEVAGGAQQQVVGHQERIIPGPPPGISAPPPVIAPPVSNDSEQAHGPHAVPHKYASET